MELDDDIQLVCYTKYLPHGYNFGKMKVEYVTS